MIYTQVVWGLLRTFEDHLPYSCLNCHWITWEFPQMGVPPNRWFMSWIIPSTNGWWLGVPWLRTPPSIGENHHWTLCKLCLWWLFSLFSENRTYIYIYMCNICAPFYRFHGSDIDQTSGVRFVVSGGWSWRSLLQPTRSGGAGGPMLKNGAGDLRIFFWKKSVNSRSETKFSHQISLRVLEVHQFFHQCSTCELHRFDWKIDDTWWTFDEWWTCPSRSIDVYQNLTT